MRPCPDLTSAASGAAKGDYGKETKLSGGYIVQR